MSLQYLVTTNNKIPVYLELELSHAATHIKSNPDLLDYASDVIAGYNLVDDEVSVEFDVGKVTGSMDLVETNDKDEIIYAKRLNRDNYTRFVKNREPSPTTLVTIVLKKLSEDKAELWSVWAGPKVPSFPIKDQEMHDSRVFWLNHALIWGRQPIQPGSETTDCPW